VTALLIRLAVLVALSYVVGCFVPPRRPRIVRPLPPPTVTIGESYTFDASSGAYIRHERVRLVEHRPA
jgi:hypothetical protein